MGTPDEHGIGMNGEERKEAQDFNDKESADADLKRPARGSKKTKKSSVASGAPFIPSKWKQDKMSANAFTLPRRKAAIPPSQVGIRVPTSEVQKMQIDEGGVDEGSGGAGAKDKRPDNGGVAQGASSAKRAVAKKKRPDNGGVAEGESAAKRKASTSAKVDQRDDPSDDEAQGAKKARQMSKRPFN